MTSSRANSTSCRFRLTPKSSSRVKFIPTIRCPRGRSANSPAITRGGGAISPSSAFAACIGERIQSCRSRRRCVRPSDFCFSKCVTKSGMIWDEVERAGLSGVTGGVVPRVRRRTDVQCHRDQAGFCRALQTGRHARGQLPVRILSRALRSSSSTTTSIRRTVSTCSGPCVRAATRSRTSISSARCGAVRSTRGSRVARRRTRAPSSTPAAPSNG